MTAPLMVRMMASPGAPPRLTVTETTYLEGATTFTVQRLLFLSLRVRGHHKMTHNKLLPSLSDEKLVTTQTTITSTKPPTTILTGA